MTKDNFCFTRDVYNVDPEDGHRSDGNMVLVTKNMYSRMCICWSIHKS
jgi:hypothetical protein